VLDLKAQLAAAGIVSAEQVKAFDEKEAKEKAAREAKAAQRQANQERKRAPGNGRGPSKGNGRGPSKGQRQGKGRTPAKKGRTSVEELKALGRGEAYDRIRKIVAHSRLDDKERTIPKPDDETFNFVTASGHIGRLYLTSETVSSLKNGTTAISSFMSNHGLSHCVLPKAIALEFSEVFPLWLRHMRGHEPLIEVPEEPENSKEAATAGAATPEASAPEASEESDSPDES